ncbi:hypothetical protein Pst134EB_026594 [Puccinia striiformis f. sp. tritici]|nr:hypothetical protein Pst134EB_026594 [Puccinia striiformis f. sp. tritici]
MAMMSLFEIIQGDPNDPSSQFQGVIDHLGPRLNTDVDRQGDPSRLQEIDPNNLFDDVNNQDTNMSNGTLVPAANSEYNLICSDLQTKLKLDPAHLSIALATSKCHPDARHMNTIFAMGAFHQLTIPLTSTSVANHQFDERFKVQLTHCVCDQIPIGLTTTRSIAFPNDARRLRHPLTTSMNPEDNFRIGDHATIDQVDEWLRAAMASHRSASESLTSSFEVDDVDIVGSCSTSTTDSVNQRSQQNSRPSVGSTAAATTPANTGTQDQQVSDPNDDKIKINLEYKLHVPKKNKKQTSTQRKRKATTTASAQNYTKLSSTPGSLSFLWPELDTNLGGFKAAAIAAIKEGAPKGTGAVAELREKENKVFWYVEIPHGGIFQAKNKTNLKDDSVFAEFLVECKHPRQGRIFTIKIFQPDPKVVAEQQEALEDLNSDGEDDEVQVPTTGAVNSSEVIGNTQTLMATHMPCERLTGSSDLLVMIDPANSDRFIPLTQERISLWARTMVVNKEVTFTNPPNSPPFKFITADEYHKFAHRDKSRSPERSASQNRISSASPQTPQAASSNPTTSNTNAGGSLNEFPTNHPNLSPASHFNAMHLGGYLGGPMSWMAAPPPWAMGGFSQNMMNAYAGMAPQNPAFLPGHLNNMPSQGAQNSMPQGFPIPSYFNNQAPPFNNQAPPSSPVPSDEHLDLDDYLRYCHVNVSSQIVRDAFDSLGISHYTDFENFDVPELQEAGLKLANARALKINMKKYERHLRSVRRRTE